MCVFVDARASTCVLLAFTSQLHAKQMLNSSSMVDRCFQSSVSTSPSSFRSRLFGKLENGGVLNERRISESASAAMSWRSTRLNSHLTPLILVDFFNNGRRLTQSSGRQPDELPCQSLWEALHWRLNSQSAEP